MHLHQRNDLLPTIAPPDRVPMEGETITKRVTSRSKADYKIDHDTGCWIWQKFCDKRGYPMVAGGKAHHAYWERANQRKLPKGWHVHHKCKTVACVNPDHLEALHPRAHHVHHWLHEKGLTLDDIRQIRELGRQPGASQSRIAKQFGISRWSVRNYWIDFTWSDLLGEDGPIVTPPPVCAYEYCDKPAVGRRDKKYCGPTCRARGQRAAAGMKPTPEKWRAAA